MADTRREDDRLLGIRISGKRAARRTALISCGEVRAAARLHLAALPCRGARGRVRRRVSAHRASRLGGVFREGRFRRPDLPCRLHGRRKSVPDRGIRILRVYLRARRDPDGGIFLFRDRNRRRDRVLCGARARCARICGRGDLRLRRACVAARAVPPSENQAEPVGVYADCGGADGALDGLRGQRELPQLPRRAGVRALRRGGICAVRRVSAVGRAHRSRNGERQCGASRVPHRRNLRLRRAAERIRHGGRRRQGVSAHFTYRAIGGVS